jgi:hypothetical protein
MVDAVQVFDRPTYAVVIPDQGGAIWVAVVPEIANRNSVFGANGNLCMQYRLKGYKQQQ